MAQHQPIRKRSLAGTSEIPDKLYFRIGEVASLCQVPAYVLRFWESEFPQLKPNKGGTGQRLYRRRDVETALRIKCLLYDEGYTIPGARQAIKSELKQAASQLALTLPESAAGMDARQLRDLQRELRELVTLLSKPMPVRGALHTFGQPKPRRTGAPGATKQPAATHRPADTGVNLRARGEARSKVKPAEELFLIPIRSHAKIETDRDRIWASSEDGWMTISTKHNPVERSSMRPHSSHDESLYPAARVAGGISIQCQICSGQGFRRSRLRGEDVKQIFLMRYPVRCLRCGQRQMVSFTVAGISIPSHVKQRRARQLAGQSERWSEPVKESLRPKGTRGPTLGGRPGSNGADKNVKS